MLPLSAEQGVVNSQGEEYLIELHEDQTTRVHGKQSLRQCVQDLESGFISHQDAEKKLQREDARDDQRRRANGVQCTNRFRLWRELAGRLLKQSMGEADARRGALPTGLRTTIPQGRKRQRRLSERTADHLGRAPPRELNKAQWLA